MKAKLAFLQWNVLVSPVLAHDRPPGKSIGLPWVSIRANMNSIWPVIRLRLDFDYIVFVQGRA